VGSIRIDPDSAWLHPPSLSCGTISLALAVLLVVAAAIILTIARTVTSARFRH
jgi:hypothetical protein